MEGTKIPHQRRSKIKAVAVVLGLVFVIGVVLFSFKSEIESGWYRLLAELGSTNAQVDVASHYLWGDRNVAEALKWYKKAAEGGSTEAMRSLADIYTEGNYAPKNYVEAFKWHLMAAEFGDKSAMYDLALAYEEGRGTPKNIEVAANWYYKSVMLGSSPSALHFGYAAQRIGDYAESYVWFSIFVALSPIFPELGEKGLREVREKLTPEELAQAQHRASELYEQILGSK